MLVLSRKKNESIVINNDITVTVVEIRGDKVRLGIVAPKEVPVHRQEVYDAIHGKEAEGGGPNPNVGPAPGAGAGAPPAPSQSAPLPGGNVGNVGAPVPSPVVVNSKPPEAPNRPL